VLEVPAGSEELPRLLRSALTLGGASGETREDQRRGEDYQREVLRRAAAEQHPDLPSFVRSIQVHVEVAPLSRAELPRAAQLSQRTNQFTLTTRRYQVSELERALDDKDALVLRALVADRFGEQGLTGLAVVRLAHGVARIEAFMLSCRVLGRFVEDAFLAAVVDAARERFGQVAVIGEHRPSSKNGQTRGFYPRCQFFEAEGDAGAVCFELPAWSEPPTPDCISLSRRSS